MSVDIQVVMRQGQNNVGRMNHIQRQHCGAGQRNAEELWWTVAYKDIHYVLPASISHQSLTPNYTQNKLHTFPHEFPVDGKLPTCHGLATGKLYGETSTMDFGFNVAEVRPPGDIFNIS